MHYHIREDKFVELMNASQKTQQGLADEAHVSIGTVTNVHNPDVGCSLRSIEAIGRVLAGDRWRHNVWDEKGRRVDLGIPLTDTHMERVPLCMFHRVTPAVRDKFYGGALSSGARVTYLSIMSRNSFSLIEEHLTDDTNLHVLTWNPVTADEIVGFSKHLSEGDDKIEQVQGALESWDRIAGSRKNITVYTYASTPTIQGVLVEDRWALVEIIPYGTPPEGRPALLLRSDEPTERPAFDFFVERFRTLLDSSVKRAAGATSSWFRVKPRP